jgi:hypothetical protein
VRIEEKALLVDEKLIRAQPERSGAFARSEYCRRGNEGPVEIALLAQQLQELCALRSFWLGRSWELGRIHGGRSR